jgi:hypothetical protein
MMDYDTILEAIRRLPFDDQLDLHAELDRLLFAPVEPDQYISDAEADADVLASAGWGTDEDYGYYPTEPE